MNNYGNNNYNSNFNNKLSITEFKSVFAMNYFDKMPIFKKIKFLSISCDPITFYKLAQPSYFSL